jgi:hypothetical protein
MSTTYDMTAIERLTPSALRLAADTLRSRARVRGLKRLDGVDITDLEDVAQALMAFELLRHAEIAEKGEN